MTWEPASQPSSRDSDYSVRGPTNSWLRMGLWISWAAGTHSWAWSQNQYNNRRHSWISPQTSQVPIPPSSSDLSSSRCLATEQDFVAAGLGNYLERVVTVNGGKRQVVFPVVMQLFLGRAPGFLTVESDPARSRLLEKVRISFNKNC